MSLCSSGKVGYDTRAQAKRMCDPRRFRKKNKHPLEPYFCRNCGHWHLTSGKLTKR